MPAHQKLFFGYLSLYLMQEVVRAWLGRWLASGFVLVMMAQSAFGRRGSEIRRGGKA